MESLRSPVDAVVLWVDGSDPLHREKLDNYLATLGHYPAAAHPTRFAETGEFEFCIASILRFLPWIRKIYIVTDNQTPAFMSMVRTSHNSERITIVDHKIIFRDYEEFLPTFNSRSLTTMLWRIPGLSEQFIYMNDDILFLRPVARTEFFRENKIVIGGSWHIQHSHRADVRLRKLLNISSGMYSDKSEERPGNRAGQAKGAEVAGYRKRYFRLRHSPHPQLRSLYEDFFTVNPEVLRNNISYPLRSSYQFLPEALLVHLALLNSKAVIEQNLSTIMLKMEKISVPCLRTRLMATDKTDRFACACIQSLDQAGPRKRGIIIEWMERRIGRLADNLHREYLPECAGL
jgi:hypothetical protein